MPTPTSGDHPPRAADEIPADERAALHVPVLVAVLVARRRIANVQRVAVRRRALGCDQEGITPAVVRGVPDEPARIGLEKPAPPRIEGHRPRVSAAELGAVERNARIAGLGICVAAETDTHLVSRRRSQTGFNRGTGRLRVYVGRNEDERTRNQDVLETT